MRFPAVWGIARHLCWDQNQTAQLLTNAGAFHQGGLEWLPDHQGAAVVLPARYYAEGDIDDLNRRLSFLDWALVILTSDEESSFPPDRLQHPRMALWTMTPRPGMHRPNHRFLGHGTPPGCHVAMGQLTSPASERPHDWAFAGQVNHERRHQAAWAMSKLKGGTGVLLQTPGFTQGMPQDDYWSLMAKAKIAPCPSGPYTPDCFRVWEALEAGCVPIVDALCPAYGLGYWEHLLGESMPFPVIENWAELPAFIDGLLETWPGNATRLTAWWLAYQRMLNLTMQGDIADLSDQDWPSENITVLVPTSSIPSHPSTAMIEQTIASIRFHLPTSEIMILCDGLRREQASRCDTYEDYLHRLTWLCQHQWTNVQPIIFESHEHQVAMCRFALDSVETPLVLFVEHDTPLVTDHEIDWQACQDVLLDGELNTIRFHYESFIPEPHMRLMLDHGAMTQVGKLNVIRTRQWSSRPHLSGTDYFRDLLHTYFSIGAKSFVEDRIHGVLQDEPWVKHRCAIYAGADGYLKRSLNLDGRQDDPKAECRF